MKINVSVVPRSDIGSVLGETFRQLEWGGFIPQAATTGYGARLIYDQSKLSVVNDRTTFFGDKEDVNRLLSQLDEDQLVATLEEQLKNHGLHQGSAEYLVIENVYFIAIASPNQSYGYVYLTAWEKE